MPSVSFLSTEGLCGAEVVGDRDAADCSVAFAVGDIKDAFQHMRIDDVLGRFFAFSYRVTAGELGNTGSEFGAASSSQATSCGCARALCRRASAGVSTIASPLASPQLHGRFLKPSSSTMVPLSSSPPSGKYSRSETPRPGSASTSTWTIWVFLPRRPKPLVPLWTLSLPTSRDGGERRHCRGAGHSRRPCELASRGHAQAE